MKKISSLLFIWIFTLYSVSFAITANDVIWTIETAYNKWTYDTKIVYDKYIWLYKNINESLNTWDYFIVSQFTGLNITWLKTNIDDRYTSLLNEIVTEKYNLSAKVDDAKNKFNAWIISTWEYEDKLNDISAQISGYQTTYVTKIQLFDTNLSWYISDFNKKLASSLVVYKNDIQNYKKLEDKLNKLRLLNQAVEYKKQKLEDIIWISKSVVDEKSQDIKDYINNYFSGYVEKEFEKYVKQDENMNYFLSGMDIKKQLVLWYISNKMDSTIENTVNNYFPTDIDFVGLNSWVNEILSVKLKDKVWDYSTFDKQIDDISDKLSSADNKLQTYLDKFWDNTNKTQVLEILKGDIVDAFKKITEIVQDDIKQTFSSRLDFVNVKEKQELSLMDFVNKIYGDKINSNSLDTLNELKTTLDNYKDIVVLPVNKQAIDNLYKVVELKILEQKNKELLKQIDILSNKIDSLQIWNDFDSIKNLRKEILNFDFPENLLNKKDVLLAKLEKKENLDKLFVSWAIKYYYRKWDLSKRVSDILFKYYNKYKNNWKLDLFMEKISKAEDKLEILKDNLRSDIRSYYIIMIDNGFIDFKTKLKEDWEI